MSSEPIRLAAFFPNYNHRHYLESSLIAMLKQADQVDHLLVIDDASTDGSQDYIREAVRNAPPCVDVVYKPANKGLFDSHAIARQRIHADFFYSASSDDWISPGFFEKCRKGLQAHPQAGLCVTNRLLFSESENRYYEQKLPITGKARYISPQEFRQILKTVDNFIFPSNSVWVNWRMLNAMGGFPESLRWHTDWFTYAVLALRAGFYYVPEELTAFRLLPGSMSGIGMTSKPAQREIFKNMMKLLTQPEYADVREAFRTPSLLGIGKNTRSTIFSCAISHPKRWWFPTLKLIKSIWNDHIRSPLFDIVWRGLGIGTLGSGDLGEVKLRVLKWFGAKIEGKPRIEPDVIIEKPWNIQLSQNVHIRRAAHLRADEPIKIDENVVIESGARLLGSYWDMSHPHQPVFRTAPLHIPRNTIVEPLKILAGGK